MAHEKVARFIRALEEVPVEKTDLDALIGSARNPADVVVHLSERLGTPLESTDARNLLASAAALQGQGTHELDNDDLEAVSGGALANMDLQNMLQRSQQSLRTIASISKTMSDANLSVIRKIGG